MSEYVPTRDERMNTPSIIPDDVAWGLRLALAAIEADSVEADTVLVELNVERGLGRDRHAHVLASLGMVTATLAHALATQVGGDVETWIYGAALGVMDQVAA
jgi:hypothetical protein